MAIRVSDKSKYSLVKRCEELEGRGFVCVHPIKERTVIKKIISTVNVLVTNTILTDRKRILLISFIWRGLHESIKRVGAHKKRES